VNRAVWFVALGPLAGALLTACDDGTLRAFEPRALTLGGSAGRGTGGAPDAGAGPGVSAGAGTSAGAGGEAPISPLLIDDFEDGDIRAQAPFGWWYPVNDQTGTQGFGIEPMSRDTGSIYALRTHGSGFVDWGSALGLDLTGETAPLDLRSYDELCFVGRVEAGSSTLIQVHLLRDDQHYTREVSLSEAWTRYCLPLTNFTNLQREALVPRELIALQFFFASAEPFHFWIDDVEVVRNGN
jgi:hypothetical protein